MLFYTLKIVLQHSCSELHSAEVLLPDCLMGSSQTCSSPTGGGQSLHDLHNHIQASVNIYTYSKWFNYKIMTLSSQITHMHEYKCVYPAVPPSAVESWTDCHRLSHCNPRTKSGPQPLPHSHQPLQSAKEYAPHSPASSTKTRWEQLPTIYTNVLHTDNTVVVHFKCEEN